jgi:uncharacterized repeat protein (TIGR03803 family)
MTSFAWFRSFGFFAAVAMMALCVVSGQRMQAQTYTVLHSFGGAPNDGAFANGELIQDTAGNLYGTTVAGGAFNNGTVYKLDPAGTVTILHSFTGGTIDGGNPQGGLLSDTQGNLFGTTQSTVFKLDASNTLKTLHAFGIGDDGAGPRSRLVTIDGDIYGVSPFGGGSEGCSGGCGIVFKMTKGGTETILYRFTGGADGGNPQGITRDAAGNLYGVASVGGVGSGTVWEINTSGMFMVLYSFTGAADGGTPFGRLIRDTNGNIHGVTVSGGDPVCNCGVVFRLDTTGRETVVHTFFGRGGGDEPFVGLLDVAGTLMERPSAGVISPLADLMAAVCFTKWEKRANTS